MITPQEQRYQGSHLVDEWLAKNAAKNKNQADIDADFIKKVREKTETMEVGAMARVLGKTVGWCWRVQNGHEPMSLKMAIKLNQKLSLGV